MPLAGRVLLFRLILLVEVLWGFHRYCILFFDYRLLGPYFFYSSFYGSSSSFVLFSHGFCGFVLFFVVLFLVVFLGFVGFVCGVTKPVRSI